MFETGVDEMSWDDTVKVLIMIFVKFGQEFLIYGVIFIPPNWVIFMMFPYLFCCEQVLNYFK